MKPALNQSQEARHIDPETQELLYSSATILLWTVGVSLLIAVVTLFLV